MDLRIPLIFLLFFALGCGQHKSEPTIYGYVEKATLVDNNMTLSAKLDTGAKSASLYATDIQQVKKNNKKYLKFNVVSKDRKIQFICEYVGNVKIKPRHDESSVTMKRPIVLMRIRIGNKEQLVRVNLANRKSFNYPLLLGREAISAFGGVVSPKDVFLIKTPMEKNAVQ